MSCSVLIVWLGATVSDSTSICNAKLANQQLQVFTEVDPCITFIQKHSEETIFFVISESFGSRVVPSIYDCENVLQIYLFCASGANYINWAMDYAGKMLIFDHEDDLLRRLFNEIEQYLRQQAEEYLQHAQVCKERAQQLKQGPCG